MREIMVKKISKRICDDLNILTMMSSSCIDFEDYKKMCDLLANKITMELYFANNVIVYDHINNNDKYSICHKN